MRQQAIPFYYCYDFRNCNTKFIVLGNILSSSEGEREGEGNSQGQSCLATATSSSIIKCIKDFKTWQRNLETGYYSHQMTTQNAFSDNKHCCNGNAIFFKQK